jgi:Tfp pilus assembly protein PilF
MGEIRSNIFYNIGVCYFNGYDMAQAELFFNEAITLNPAYVKALHQRSIARLEMGRVDESFSDIKQAFSLDSSSADIHASYSKILEACSKNTKE